MLLEHRDHLHALGGRESAPSPTRSMYSRRMSVSMISARVAGVPRPRSFIASRALFVVDELAGGLHRREQRRLRVARRRLRLLRLACASAQRTVMPSSSCGSSPPSASPSSSCLRRVVGLDAVDAAPAGLERDLAARAEALAPRPRSRSSCARSARAGGRRRGSAWRRGRRCAARRPTRTSDVVLDVGRDDRVVVVDVGVVDDARRAAAARARARSARTARTRGSGRASRRSA